MPGRGCGDGTGNSKGVLHLTLEQFVAICGSTGREGKIGNAEAIVVQSQVTRSVPQFGSTAKHHVRCLSLTPASVLDRLRSGTCRS